MGGDVREALRAAEADAARFDLAAVDPPLEPRGWTLAPDALRFVASLALRLAPRRVLELGSGLSTQALAWACAQGRSDCRITTLDHDPEFSRATAQVLERPGSRAPVAVVTAPLVLREWVGEAMPTYALAPERLAAEAPFDLVLIDGPPLALGGRRGTLYQILDFTRAGTLVLLDDADRASEREAVAHWQSVLGDAIAVERLPGFERGLVAVLVREPVRAVDLASHRLRLAARDLDGVAGPDAGLILVDEAQWADSDVAHGRRTWPFLERDGAYWGPPPDDETAIRELERLRAAGARYAVFGWPAFWWLDHYAKLADHLRSAHRCVLENGRLVVFDLCGDGGGDRGGGG